MRIGCFLSCEEFTPRQLLEQARLAQDAGLDRLWISDHYHPWNDEQGQSPFVWSMIGAIAAAVSGMHVTTAVTCPTVRIHPAVIAQAAATSSVLLGGRFSLGVGSGEALNEHILADPWPEAAVRQEMLEEAIEVAARVGDGFCTVGPDADAVTQFRRDGGGNGVVQGGTKVCFGPDAGECVKTVHRLWPNEGLPGELSQILPQPAHFEQASQLVTEEMIAESLPCGPDVDKIAEEFQSFA